MGLSTGIEWTDATWNPWQGCTKVSPACKNCYMFREKRRYGQDPEHVVRSKPGTFNLPLKKNQDGTFKIPDGSKIFTCSWSDWFHEVADPWRPEAWSITQRRRDAIFQIVTKRAERIGDCLPDDWAYGYENVWLIVTAEDQQWLNERMSYLADIPGKVRGLSVEPMLGPITIRRWVNRPRPLIDWVIVGGESGPNCRVMDRQWVEALRDECQTFGIPFFFKQWGDRDEPGEPGRMLDGREWSEFPAIAV